MRSRSCCAALLSFLALSVPALAQTPAAPVETPAVPVKAVPVKHPAPTRKPAKAAAKPAVKPAKTATKPSPRPKQAKSSGAGTWIRINAHMLGLIGESTWVNLAQASSIRFYQSGKTPFAAVGTGGSNFVSTSDPAEIQRLRAYVTSRQFH